MTISSDLQLYAQWYCPIYSACTTCNGSKYATSCSGTMKNDFTSGTIIFCEVCQTNAARATQCSKCGVAICRNCYSNVSQSITLFSHYCLTCSGSGTINTCTHSQTEAHYY